MNAYAQAPKPVVKFSHSFGEPCHTFSAVSGFSSGKNLLAYSFERSTDNLVGTFSVTIKEDTQNQNQSESFFDKVKHLDVVTICENENEKSDFLGIVNKISISASIDSSGKVQKMISISGKSIEALFDMFMISLDATAMSWVRSDTTDINLKSRLATNGGNAPLGIGEAIEIIWKTFVELALKYQEVSSIHIYDMIQHWFGSSFLDIDTKLTFCYPISSNLFGRSICTAFEAVRNLLPRNVYEMFGTVLDGKPKITVRECPFDSDVWNKLPSARIPAQMITAFDLGFSNDEVYTVFMSYLEGSVRAADFYKAVRAGKAGYQGISRNVEKMKIYGYRPLQCNFVGYNTELSATEKIAEQAMDDINKKLSELDERVANWYGSLDEVLCGTVDIANIYSEEKPKLGQRAKVFGGEFYVINERHTWRYGGNPAISYSLDRGGEYTGGNFQKLNGLSLPYAEYKG